MNNKMFLKHNNEYDSDYGSDEEIYEDVYNNVKYNSLYTPNYTNGIIFLKKGNNYINFNDSDLSMTKSSIMEFEYKNCENLNDIVDYIISNNISNKPLNIVAYGNKCNDCIKLVNILGKTSIKISLLILICNSNDYNSLINYNIPVVILEKNLNKLGLQELINSFNKEIVSVLLLKNFKKEIIKKKIIKYIMKFNI